MKRGKKQPVSSRQAIVQTPLEAEEADDWGEKIDHLEKGYDTAQSVIQFLDTKGNILIGLSTLVAGFAASLVKWTLELNPRLPASWERVSAENESGAVYALLLMGLSFLAFVAVVLCCLFSVIARKAPIGKFTILFPVVRKDATSWWRKISMRMKGITAGTGHKEKVVRAVNGLDRKAILAEYSEQLEAVGRILENKLNHNRWASVAAVIQLMLFSGAIGIYFGIATGLVR